MLGPDPQTCKSKRYVRVQAILKAGMNVCYDRYSWAVPRGDLAALTSDLSVDPQGHSCLASSNLCSSSQAEYNVWTFGSLSTSAF